MREDKSDVLIIHFKLRALLFHFGCEYSITKSDNDACCLPISGAMSCVPGVQGLPQAARKFPITSWPQSNTTKITAMRPPFERHGGSKFIDQIAHHSDATLGSRVGWVSSHFQKQDHAMVATSSLQKRKHICASGPTSQRSDLHRPYRIQKTPTVILACDDLRS